MILQKRGIRMNVCINLQENYIGIYLESMVILFLGTVYITGIERRHSTTCQLLNTLDGTGTVQGKLTGNSLEGSYDYSNPTHYGGDYRIRKFTADLSQGKDFRAVL